MLSYEFVPIGSVLQEKIENDCDTILDKTCWHMLKKGTFPPKFLNKSTLLWNKVSVAPLPPEQCCNKRFPYSTEKFRWQWAQHATPNQHCPRERGFVSTVLSKIVLEKDSGKHRSIMIEPVDCHLYKILHPERTALHCSGWKELNVFFFERSSGCQRSCLYFLLMLEGQKWCFSAKYVICKKTCVFDCYTPIFCTGKRLHNLYQGWCC